jgi:hypothetical protein
LDSKFSRAYTKSETVAVNVLAPLAKEELHKELNDARFISVSSDVSNGKSVKLIQIRVQYFYPIHGIKVKLLKVYSLKMKHLTLL